MIEAKEGRSASKQAMEVGVVETKVKRRGKGCSCLNEGECRCRLRELGRPISRMQWSVGVYPPNWGVPGVVWSKVE